MYAYPNIPTENSSLKPTWVRNNLARQFMLVAAGVLILGMFAFGTWVSRRIEYGVAEMAANSAALYINSFIAPHLQTLSSRDTLSPDNTEAIDRAIRRVFKVHITDAHIGPRPDGRVVYSTNAALVGKKFEPGPACCARGMAKSRWNSTRATKHQMRSGTSPDLP